MDRLRRDINWYKKKKKYLEFVILINPRYIHFVLFNNTFDYWNLIRWNFDENFDKKNLKNSIRERCDKCALSLSLPRNGKI